MKLRLAVPMETVDLGLCMVQLFNVRKMYCWTVFGYNRIRIDRAARHGIQLKEELPGVLVQINDESTRTATENTRKEKNERAPRKPNLMAILAKYKQNIAQILKDVQIISNSLKVEEVKEPCLPGLTTFRSQSATVDLPEHILRSLSDTLFLSDEMHILRPDVTTQRDVLLNSLIAWRAVD